MLADDLLLIIHVWETPLWRLDPKERAQWGPSISHLPFQQSLLRHHFSHMSIVLVISLQALLSIVDVIVAKDPPASERMRADGADE